MSGRTRQFRLRPVSTLVVMLAVGLFCGLGVWQLDRAGQKRALAERLEQRRQMPPYELLGEAAASADELEFRTLVARGRFHPEKQIFIENRKHRGENGFHVLSPLGVEGSGRFLLVNRGWVAAAPDLALPRVATPEGVVEVRGEAVVPSPPALDLRPDRLPGDQRRWPFVTLEGYAAWSGLSLHPFMLLQSGDEAGFVRAWQRPLPSDGMHIGYAIQWFAFALIALAIWYRLSSGRGRGEGGRP